VMARAIGRAVGAAAAEMVWRRLSRSQDGGGRAGDRARTVVEKKGDVYVHTKIRGVCWAFGWKAAEGRPTTQAPRAHARQAHTHVVKITKSAGLRRQSPGVGDVPWGWGCGRATEDCQGGPAEAAPAAPLGGHFLLDVGGVVGRHSTGNKEERQSDKQGHTEKSYKDKGATRGGGPEMGSGWHRKLLVNVNEG
jgi:hypothetical protein